MALQNERLGELIAVLSEAGNARLTDDDVDALTGMLVIDPEATPLLRKAVRAVRRARRLEERPRRSASPTRAAVSRLRRNAIAHQTRDQSTRDSAAGASKDQRRRPWVAAPMKPYLTYDGLARRSRMNHSYQRVMCYEVTLLHCPVGGVELMLNTAYDSGGRPGERDAQRIARHADTCVFIGCSDLDGVYAEYAQSSLAIEPPAMAGYSLRRFSLRDPDNFELVFQETGST